MGRNIFEIWAANGKRVPFAVRRDNWSSSFYAIVEEVQITKWPYGEARGVPTVNGEPNDHFAYDAGWRRNRTIPNAGSYQWTLVEIGLPSQPSPESANGTTRKPRPVKKPRVLTLSSAIGFGKYKEQPLSEVLKDDPQYLGWMLRTVETVVIDPDVIAECNQVTREMLGEAGISMNAERFALLSGAGK